MFLSSVMGVAETLFVFSFAFVVLKKDDIFRKYPKILKMYEYVSQQCFDFNPKLESLEIVI